MDTDVQLVQALLAGGAALTLGEIDAALRTQGRPSMPPNRLEVLVEKVQGATPIVGDRWVAAKPVIEGRTFTHALSDAETSSDLLISEPDLAAIDGLAIDRLVTVGGEPVVSVDPDFHVDIYAEAGLLDGEAERGLLFPDGSLAGLAGSGLVGVRLDPDGELEVWSVDAVDDVAGEAIVRALQQLVREHESDDPLETDAVVLSVCVANPDAFRTPVAPVSELFERAGLVRRGAFVASDGFDFDTWEYESEVHRSVHLYRLDEPSARAAVDLARYVDGISAIVAALFVEAAARAEQSGSASDTTVPASGMLDDLEAPNLPTVTEPVAFALRRLADPGVAKAVLAMTVGSEEFTALPLSLAVNHWRSTAPRGSRPALAWLEGKALERLGEHTAAERAYDAAETLDPSSPLALIELARYASDRGDAVRAVSLLGRAGVGEDDDERSILAHYATADAPLDRNAPCWCGSGRRLKACHRSAPPLPLEERGAWLHHKAVVFLIDGPWREELLELAQERSRYWTEREALLRGISDALVHDVMLHEGGVFEEFLEERGYLLPEDERELAETWIGLERSVFDVEEVVAGARLGLRDIRTGERIWVSERLATQTLRPGMLIATRLLPCGEQWQMFGGVESVSLMQRDALIELFDDAPDPVDVVAALSARYAPPTLVTTTGEPLVIRAALIEVDDMEGFIDCVNDRYEPAGNEWVRVVDAVVHSTLRVRDGMVRIETLSEERMDDELDWASDLSMFVRVVEDDVIPIDGTEEFDDPAPELDPSDPRVAEVLAQAIAGYEERWLDESIPALGGVTPRRAADDPTRRPDLIRLLASFPKTENGMSARRLAAALGLNDA